MGVDQTSFLLSNKTPTLSASTVNVNSITLNNRKHTRCGNLAAETFTVNLFHTVACPVFESFLCETLVLIYERHAVGGLSSRQSALAVLSFSLKHTSRCRSADCPGGSLFFSPYLPIHHHFTRSSPRAIYIPTQTAFAASGQKKIKNTERENETPVCHAQAFDSRQLLSIKVKISPCGVGESVDLGKVP